MPEEVESDIVKILEFCASMKAPFDGFDLRCVVQNLLNACNVNSKVFKDNMPGPDWLAKFIKRNKLTKRIADNVKTSRAEVTPDVINQYFDDLQVSLEGVAPSDIYNYDETNLRDDPGKKLVISRRGRRRVERKIDSSKSCISIMFCRNSVGDYMPCMVVHKSKHVYVNWTRGAPAGTCFDSTKSGWFDGRTFTQWFKNVFVPNLRGDGPFALIGDNLGSHFLTEIIELCNAKNIRFITLPPNSSHLTQPLDVAVFRVVKRVWATVMEEWRKESRRKQVLPKEIFPLLLRRLLSGIKGGIMASGFRACGISPFDPQQVPKRIQVTNEEVARAAKNHLGSCFTAVLEQNIGTGKTPSTRSKKRGRKIRPGLIVMADDLISYDRPGPSIVVNPFANLTPDPISPIKVRMVNGMGYIVGSNKE